MTREILAQVREDPEVLLAPALEVFAGTGTSEEIYLVTITLLAAGLIIAIIAVNVTLVLHKFTWSLAAKIFSLWFLFAAAASIIPLTRYLADPTRPVIQAEVAATPRNVTVRVAESQITLLWETDKPTLGQLKYKIQDQAYKVANSNQGLRTNNHQIILKRDSNTTEYWFVIVSDNFEYGSQGQPLYLRL